MKIAISKRIFLYAFLSLLSFSASCAVWTIAIDPGHGGKDPGAIGRELHLKEKDVTLSIARELKALLDKDPNFRAVLTRKGDYFISVPERSEIARRNKANYLVSIHADSSTSPSLRGASVWVLSNRRANNEMGQWLEDNEKQSELLGGAGDVLARHNEKYLDQTVLDLQFGHSQRVGYELGNIVLRRFANITALSHSKPQHASLGVLRSPDIPSILVETGFLSNAEEERKLGTSAYRQKIANIIYQGLVEYRKRHPSSGAYVPPPLSKEKSEKTEKAEKTDNSTNSDKDKKDSDKKDSKENKSEKSKEKSPKDSGQRHLVKSGDMLSKLALRYGVKEDEIMQLNNLKQRDLLIGQNLKIPAKEKGLKEEKAKEEKSKEEKSKQEKTKDEKNSKDEKNAKSAGKNSEVSSDKKDKGDKKANKEDKKTDSNKEKSEKKFSGKLPKYHVVEQDQTLYAISRFYQIPVDKLIKLNKLKDGKVVTGQKIRLQE